MSKSYHQLKINFFLNRKNFLLNIIFATLILCFTILTSCHLNANPCPHYSDLRDDCLVARTHGGGSSGKWLNDVTPKRGWACTGAEDLGPGNTEECEMCEREQVRYVHYMRHGDQDPLELNVGCICSGHMEGLTDTQGFINQTLLAAKQRTTALQNRTDRRSKFPTLAGWRVSKQNNAYLRKDGHHTVIINGKYGKFSAIVDREQLGQWLGTTTQVKLAVFDKLYPPIVH